jgi:hypothetical protein
VRSRHPNVCDQVRRFAGQGLKHIPAPLGAVDRTERMTAKSFALSSERNPPEIFWRSFIIRPFCSARLLVKADAGIGQEAKDVLLSGAQSQQRVIANPSRRTGRRLVFARAGWPSWNARPSARLPS